MRTNHKQTKFFFVFHLCCVTSQYLIISKIAVFAVLNDTHHNNSFPFLRASEFTTPDTHTKKKRYRERATTLASFSVLRWFANLVARPWRERGDKQNERNISLQSLSADSQLKTALSLGPGWKGAKKFSSDGAEFEEDLSHPSLLRAPSLPMIHVLVVPSSLGRLAFCQPPTTSRKPSVCSRSPLDEARRLQSSRGSDVLFRCSIQGERGAATRGAEPQFPGS